MIRILLTTATLLALLCPPLVNAAAKPVGKVIAVSGKANVIRSSDSSRHALAFKDPVFLNDRIVTAADGQVKLLLNDDSILKVSPTSELHVSELLIGPGEESRTTINLLKGKLRSIIGRKLEGNSRFEVHTDVAVAGVRGTDFEVTSNGETLIRCFTGVVEVSNIDPGLAQRVRLLPNMFTRIRQGRPPAPPTLIPPGKGLPASPAGQGPREGEPPPEGGGDPLAIVELEQLGEGEGISNTDPPPLLLELFQPAPPPLSERLLDKSLYGDPTREQLDTVSEPPQNTVTVPLDVRIPAP